MRKFAAVLAALSAGSAAAQAPAPVPLPLQLWRLDCGLFDIEDLEGRGPYAMPVSCYLIQHGDNYVLFDVGLGRRLAGKPEVQPHQTLSLHRTLEEQLAEIGVEPAQVRTLVVSHYHGDHHGQADSFPGARLMIGAADLAALRKAIQTEGVAKSAIAPWLRGERRVAPVERETDVFGDGRVVVLPTPGHTPGHVSLLVRLANASYILSGDAVHLRAQFEDRQASDNHVDKDRALQTIDLLKKLELNLGASLVVGHDREDIAKLPAFPEAAR